MRSAIIAFACVFAAPQVHAQALQDRAVLPAKLLQRSYEDYIHIKTCQQQQKPGAFVSSDDFISSNELRRAHIEISEIEHLVAQFDPTIDRDKVWKQASSGENLLASGDRFDALMMLSLKSHRERCRYYLSDLESTAETLLNLTQRVDKDF